MALIFRNVKGSALTYTEMDENLRLLYSASVYNATGSGAVAAFPYTGSAIVSGSLQVVGPITSSGGYFGTSSWSSQARTASYVLTAQTASYILIAQTASYYGGSVTSASYSSTSSYVSNIPSPFPYTGSAIISGSIEITGSIRYKNSTLITAKSGLKEYNNSFYNTKGSGLRYAEGGIIADFYDDKSNTGIIETDLYAYTFPSNSLDSNGEKIELWFGGTFNDITATVRLRLYFAGTVIGDTGALTVSATGGWNCSALIIKTGADTARSIVTLSTPGASTAVYTNETDIAGINFSNTNIGKVTGQAGGAGGSDNDITAKLGTIYWYGSANN
jgi:hypothetical protein